MCDHFASFCWLWDFLLENLKLKKNSDDIHWNVWINIKTSYARNNISEKRIPNMRFYIFWSKFCFFGDCFRTFFVVGQSWWSTFLLSPPTIKKLLRPWSKAFDKFSCEEVCNLFVIWRVCNLNATEILEIFLPFEIISKKKKKNFLISG